MELTEDIREAALACYPYEMCGVITPTGFTLCSNKHEFPKENFLIGAEELASIAAKEQILGVIHSHCEQFNTRRTLDLRTPSLNDMLGQVKSKIPWYITGTDGETVLPLLQIPRVPNSDYIGRNFIWYINDCYTLVQDYYLFELNINLQAHNLNIDLPKLTDTSFIFENFLQEYGFTTEVEFKDLQNGDIAVLNYNHKQRNHLAIFHEGNFLHQDILSCSVPCETLINRISGLYRYENLHM